MQYTIVAAFGHADCLSLFLVLVALDQLTMKRVLKGIVPNHSLLKCADGEDWLADYPNIAHNFRL